MVRVLKMTLKTKKHISNTTYMFTTIKTENDDKSAFIYIPNILNTDDIKILQEWISTLEFFSGVSYKNNVIHRKQIWFQEDEKYFCEKWKNRYPRWVGNKYSDVLYDIQDKIKNQVDKIKSDIHIPIFSIFNSCLINLYENGKDKIPPHRDSKLSFGKTPTIVNLSLGETRVIRLTQNKTHIDIPLEHNSLFIMAGESQLNYTHEILEDSAILNKRHSLTFRELL